MELPWTLCPYCGNQQVDPYLVRQPALETPASDDGSGAPELPAEIIAEGPPTVEPVEVDAVQLAGPQEELSFEPAAQEEPGQPEETSLAEQPAATEQDLSEQTEAETTKPVRRRRTRRKKTEEAG
jgi:hypothetical protein